MPKDLVERSTLNSEVVSSGVFVRYCFLAVIFSAPRMAKRDLCTLPIVVLVAVIIRNLSFAISVFLFLRFLVDHPVRFIPIPDDPSKEFSGLQRWSGHLSTLLGA